MIRDIVLSAGRLLTFVAPASTQNSSNGTSITVAKPTGTIDGDLMVAFICADGDVMTWTLPAGWTSRAEKIGNVSVVVATKVASSEGTSYAFTVARTNKLGGSIVTYRNGQYGTVGTYAANATTIVAPQITVADNQTMLLAYVVSTAATGMTFSTPSGMTALVLGSDGTKPDWEIFYQVVNAGATGTRSSTPSNTAASNTGILVSVAP